MPTGHRPRVHHKGGRRHEQPLRKPPSGDGQQPNGKTTSFIKANGTTPIEAFPNNQEPIMTYGEMIPIGGGDPIPLLKDELLVGRRESCDICLRFANVSAHHCKLTLKDGYWYVEDLGSRNGTKVNGHRVQKKRLDPGDSLAVAKHVYRVEYSPADLGALGPPPPEEDNAIKEILGQSLLERAGLQRRTQDKTPGRYDVTRDEGGRFKDPNRPV